MINVIIWVSVSAGIVADNWYGLEWAGNISIFVVWFFAVFSLLVLLMPDEKFLEAIKDEGTIKKYLFRAFYFIAVNVMLAAGWFVTATASVIGFVLVYAKTASAKEKLSEKSKEA